MDPAPEASNRLIGWKRIAAHLGCSERTARRWEAEEALPVRRQVHEAKSTVYAFAAELDAWISSRGVIQEEPTRAKASHGWHGSQLALLAAALVIVMLSAVIVWGAIDGRKGQSPSNAPLSQDATALDLYERGLALWEQRGEDANRKAIRNLRSAVERDPKFAEAWAALASAHATLPTYSTDTDLEEALDQALIAADQALRLKPELVEPRTLMGEIAERRGEWALARQIFEGAMAAAPENWTIALWTAGHYRETGYLTRSLQLTERALALETNAPPALNEFAMTHFFFGDAERGEQELDFLWNELGFDTPIIWYAKWFAYYRKGDFASLKTWQELCPFATGCELFDQAAVVAQADEDARADFTKTLLSAYEEGLPAFLTVSLLQVTADADAMLDVAETQSKKGRFVNIVVLYDPVVADLRRSPRFTEIAERFGLLEYWTQMGAPDFCAVESDADVCRTLAR